MWPRRAHSVAAHERIRCANGAGCRQSRPADSGLRGRSQAGRRRTGVRRCRFSGNNTDPRRLAVRDRADRQHLLWPRVGIAFARRSYGNLRTGTEGLTSESNSGTTPGIMRRAAGEPNLRQLEPDGELAKPAPGAPRSRIVKRAGVYESLPAEWARSLVRASRLLNYDEQGRSPALRRGYSILSATIGSTPAALRAG